MINYGNGYYIEPPKRSGSIITYGYKITDIAGLNSQIEKYDASSKIGPMTVKYVKGEVACDCSTFKTKSTTTFFGHDDKVVVSYTDPEYTTRADEMVKALCEMTDK